MRVVLEVTTDRSPADLAAVVSRCFVEQHQVKLEALMALYERADPDEEEKAKIQALISELKLLDALRDGRVVSMIEG